MKHFLKSSIFVAVLCCTFLGSAPLSAQEWSKEQKEVWNNIETYWGFWAKRDVNGFLSYFSDDYSGWYDGSALPSDKSSANKWLSQMFSDSEVLVYEIKPVAINVHGNFAFVHYYYSDLTKNSEGKKKMERGRWTDILKKDGNRWLLIGDHGGESDSDN
jgi:ketosteroid isomerase-like protein